MKFGKSVLIPEEAAAEATAVETPLCSKKSDLPPTSHIFRGTSSPETDTTMRMSSETIARRMRIVFASSSLQGPHHANEDRVSVAEIHNWTTCRRSGRSWQGLPPLQRRQPPEPVYRLLARPPRIGYSSLASGEVISGPFDSDREDSYCISRHVIDDNSVVYRRTCSNEVGAENRDVHRTSPTRAVVFTVCDGHDGAQAAEAVMKSAPIHLYRQWHATIDDSSLSADANYGKSAAASVVDVCKRAMRELDKEFRESATSPNGAVDTAGACVVLVLCLGNQLWCSNLGDCKAGILQFTNPEDVLRSTSEVREEDNAKRKGNIRRRLQKVRQNFQFVWLSAEHRSRSHSEVKRITSLGGWFESGRLGGMLEPTRTIGDFDVKDSQPNGCLSCDPEVRVFQVDRPSLLLIGTDGVWDGLPGKEIFAQIQKQKRLWNQIRAATFGLDEGDEITSHDLEALANTIIRRARSAGSDDDCTLLVAMLFPE